MPSKASNLIRMPHSKALTYTARAFLIASIPLAVMIMGLVSGAGYFGLDAWNSHWNDEVGYYHMVQTMREFGPFGTLGMQGYNEALLGEASYGPYPLTTYYLYAAASFFFDLGSHNLVYDMNMVFGILTCVAIVAIARPQVTESVLLGAFFAFQFVIARHAASGLVEMSYLLICLAATSFCLHVFRSSHAEASAGAVLSLAAAAALFAYAGSMRPFFLAFELVPLYLVFARRSRFSRTGRSVLLAIIVACTLAALWSFFDFRFNYRAPYLDESSDLDRLGMGFGGFLLANLDCIRYTAASLYHQNWQGIILATFYLECALLAVLAASNRGKEPVLSGLFLCFLLIGVAIYETNLVMYDAYHMDRMLLALIAVYALLICLAANNRLRTAFVCASAALGLLMLLLDPTSYALSQKDESSITDAEQVQIAAMLQDAIPQSQDAWDNTMAKPMETTHLQLFFLMPAYASNNSCGYDYLQDAIESRTLRSKYVCVPLANWRNPEEDKSLDMLASDEGKLVYEDEFHRIYQMRER